MFRPDQNLDPELTKFQKPYSDFLDGRIRIRVKPPGSETLVKCNARNIRNNFNILNPYYELYLSFFIVYFDYKHTFVVLV